jgi:hypothetical protein
MCISFGLKQLGREAGHSPPYSAEIKNEWSHTSPTPTSLHGMDRAKFTLMFYISLTSSDV